MICFKYIDLIVTALSSSYHHSHRQSLHHHSYTLSSSPVLSPASKHGATFQLVEVEWPMLAEWFRQLDAHSIHRRYKINFQQFVEPLKVKRFHNVRDIVYRRGGAQKLQTIGRTQMSEGVANKIWDLAEVVSTKLSHLKHHQTAQV